jgi:single-stranded-DNA-specific exonuclease
MTKWLDPQPVETAHLDILGLPPLVAQCLVRRGYATPLLAKAFLEPVLSSSSPGSELPGVESAVERLITAIRGREAICVWGDFDVDGQTSTTILVQTLRSLGAEVTYHIPIRGIEGHGVNLDNLKSIIDSGVNLIVTCDTGISAYEEVEYARSRSVDFIITDHHDLPDKLPNAIAIVNPKLLSNDHALADLPGAGVAYNLCEKLLDDQGSRIKGGAEEPHLQAINLLDLAALGTIADLALLRGDTRAIARLGINVLRKSERLGLMTVAQLAHLDLSKATEETIAFNLAPRLNALGRLDDANPSVDLFLTNDPTRARNLAARIESLNTQRRLLTEQVFQAAETQLRSDPTLLTQPIILLMHASWPGGVIGLVASRLVERYHKAVILLTTSKDGILSGSARSVERLHITEAIAANKKYLIGFGGHPMAAGLSLTPDNLVEFRKGINKSVEKSLSPMMTEDPTLQVDGWLELTSLSLDLADGLEAMAPFGPGNPSPLFATHGLTIRSIKEIGKAKEHIRLIITQDQKTVQDVIWWNGGGDGIPEILVSEGNKFDLAYRLRSNTYLGERKLSLEFVDFRVTEQKPVEILKEKLEIRDLRLRTNTVHLPPSTLIWAEGEEKSKGKNRYELFEADELAIWTTPPSPVVLKEVLNVVRPRIINLIAVSPQTEKPDEFLSHLAGMSKFVINRRSGRIKIADLAANTAQREVTIKLGLEWLAASGHLIFEIQDDYYLLMNGDKMANPYIKNELLVAIKGSLEETDAYRLHFKYADPNSIFN